MTTIMRRRKHLHEIRSARSGCMGIRNTLVDRAMSMFYMMVRNNLGEDGN
jgi:hypothetical protein